MHTNDVRYLCWRVALVPAKHLYCLREGMVDQKPNLGTNLKQAVLLACTVDRVIQLSRAKANASNVKIIMVGRPDGLWGQVLSSYGIGRKEESMGDASNDSPGQCGEGEGKMSERLRRRCI